MLKRQLIQARQIFDTMRLAPFDISTEEGRSQERHRRIALTAIASVIAKAITIATSLITVPLTLNYLGGERYGLWMTISSVIAMMVFADFGIGNGLMNAVAEAYGNDDKDAIKSHVANAIVILGIVAIVILFLFFIAYPFIRWGAFFNVKTILAIQESGPALTAFIVCFALGIPACIVQRVQMGLQQGFASSLWLAGGSVLGFLLTLVVIHFRGGLPWLVIALSGSPLVVLLCNGVIFYFIQHRDLLPDMQRVSRKGMVLILRGGMLFFMLQLTVSIAFASDNIIIARIINTEAVSQYSVVSKLFEGVVIIIVYIFAPLWPAYGEAKARGDRVWIKNTLTRSMVATFVMVVFMALLLVMFHKALFAYWVGSQHTFAFTLVVWYAVWIVFKGLNTTYSMFLNGMNVVRLQLFVSFAYMCISIIAKLYFITYFGLPGLLMGLVLSWVLVSILPYALYARRFLRGENG
jgi:O-antigen/teichoic acid export membrane protein